MKEYHKEGILREMYWEKGMSLPEIGDDFGIDQATVHYWMEKHNIERRKSWDKRPPSVNTTSDGYQYTASECSGETDQVLIHRLVAVAEWGFDVVCDKDVHHINGVKWDNRAANLEIMSRSEHMEHHMNQAHRKEKLSEWGRQGAIAKEIS